jgi:hypothetical protein
MIETAGGAAGHVHALKDQVNAELLAFMKARTVKQAAPAAMAGARS